MASLTFGRAHPDGVGGRRGLLCVEGAAKRCGQAAPSVHAREPALAPTWTGVETPTCRPMEPEYRSLPQRWHGNPWKRLAHEFLWGLARAPVHTCPARAWPMPHTAQTIPNQSQAKGGRCRTPHWLHHKGGKAQVPVWGACPRSSRGRTPGRTGTLWGQRSEVQAWCACRWLKPGNVV
jgi:hypothetical protein